MDVGGCRRTLATIDLEACRHNLRRLRDRVADKDIWPVVKADAYGHGAVRVARALSAERITGFCVATPTEGRELRQGGVSQPILVMAGLFEGSPNEAYELAVEYGLSCGIQDFAATHASSVRVFSGSTGAELTGAPFASPYPLPQRATSLAAASDLTGNSLSDLIIGSTGGLFFGQPQVFVISLPSGVPLPYSPILAPIPSGGFGLSVAGAGDVDGDGTPDLAAGTSPTPGVAGGVHIFDGVTGALIRSIAGTPR